MHNTNKKVEKKKVNCVRYELLKLTEKSSSLNMIRNLITIDFYDLFLFTSRSINFECINI